MDTPDTPGPHVRERGVVLDGRYELAELIGTGGMAEVWRACDQRLTRDVAVKLLSGGAVRDESNRRRIAREARALAASTHPNIVAVYDYGEDDATSVDVHPFLVMELVDGPDLHRYLDTRGPLPVDEARDVMVGILGAVECAHTAGVIHGDLKPANVFMGSHGPKVGDFGVARILDQETGTTTVAATPTYAAPEVLKGDRASAATDVYSAGCLAFQLLTGRPPFDGANGWEIATKHMEAPIPRVRKFRSDVPADLDAAIVKAMDKEPKRRYPSAAAFLEALSGIAIAPAVAATSASETVPLAGVTSPDGEPTTSLTRKFRPERVALLGPLAPVVDGIGRASRSVGRRIPRTPQRRALLVALAVVLLGVAFLMFRDTTPSAVALPDVRGESVRAAAGQLQLKGFKVSGYSYEVVTDAEKVNRVISTIPAAGDEIAPGSEVHLIAGAVASTPAPVVRQSGGNDDDDGGGGGDGDGDGGGGGDGKRNKKRGRD